MINTYTVGSNPAGVALDAADTELYVANEADGTLTVIDTRSGSTLATIPLGINPHVLLSRDGHIYALDRQHGDLAMVGAGRQVGEVMHLADNTFNVAQDMAFDPSGKTLYVTLQDPVALNTALTAVDIASRQMERKLTLNGLSKGVVMNYYGTHLYVAVDAASWSCARLHAVSVTDFTVTHSVELDHGVDAISAQSGDIRALNNLTNELVPISMADLAFRRPTALEPGAHVLGNFYGGPVGLAISSIQTPWISERWRWMRLRKRR